jgi:hypothetical protein
VLAEIAAGAAVVPAFAWVSHRVASHHAHLTVLRALHAPVDVPPARLGSWWHGLGLTRQVVMGAVLVLAGAMCGLAWVLSPAAAAASVSVAVAGLAVATGIRASVRRQS